MKKVVYLIIVALAFSFTAAFAQDTRTVDVQTIEQNGGTIMNYLLDNANNVNGVPFCYDNATVADEQYNCLVAVLQATGLDKTLDTAGTYTLFAPTDAAFKVYGEKAIDNLVANPDQLKALLSYHVLPKAFSLDQLYYMSSEGMVSLASVEGANVQINFEGGSDASVDTPMPVSFGDNMGTDMASWPHAQGNTISLDNGNLIIIDHLLTMPTM